LLAFSRFKKKQLLVFIFGALLSGSASYVIKLILSYIVWIVTCGHILNK